jgi:hypothetical protein
MATVKALNIAIGADTQGFRRGLKRSESTLTKFRRTAMGVGAGVAKGLAVGAAGIAAVGTAIGLSVRSFAQFESGMLRVQAVTGATDSEFQALTEQAKQLGATTAFSAKQAAEGMGFLGQAGFSATEIQAAMGSVLNLAAAGALELADAADITASVLRGFGMNAKEATKVTDILAKAAASSNTSVQEMGEGFKFVGPVASAMGISIEETAAALSVLSDAGLKGSLAGTGLRQALVKMGPDIIRSGGLLPALKALDSEGIRAVTEAMDSLGARAGTAAIALANNTERAEELEKVYKNSSGAAQEMADTLMSGVTGAGLEVASAFEAVKNNVGEAFGDVTIGFLGAFSEALRVLAKLVEGLGDEFALSAEDGRTAFLAMIDVVEAVSIAVSQMVDTIRGGFLVMRFSVAQGIKNMLQSLKQVMGVVETVSGFVGLGDRGDDFKKASSAITDLQKNLVRLQASDAKSAVGLFDVSGIRSTFEEIRDAISETKTEAADMAETINGELSDISTEIETKIKPTFAEMFPDLAGIQKDIMATSEEITKILEAAGVSSDVIAKTIEDGFKLADLKEIEKRLEELKLAEALLGTGALEGAIDVARLRETILSALPEVEAKAAEAPEPVDVGPDTLQTVLGAVKVDAGAQKKDSQNLDSIAKSNREIANKVGQGAFI